jgi:hypothetical protein
MALIRTELAFFFLFSLPLVLDYRILVPHTFSVRLIIFLLDRRAMYAKSILVPVDAASSAANFCIFFYPLLLLSYESIHVV